jgi:hypothetical protein
MMTSDDAAATVEQKLSDRQWRIDNLYTIKDKKGNRLPFKRNAAQIAYTANMWWRDLIVKARQLGLSTIIELLILDALFFRKDTNAGIVDVTQDKATEKLDIIRTGYEGLPEDLRATNPLTKDNQRELQFANGSSVTAGVTYRGGTVQILHVSEYGKTSVDRPKVATEIKTGAMQAVPLDGWLALESTAHGTNGEFYTLSEQAKAKRDQGTALTELDFKHHFYAWHIDPRYRLPNNLVTITHELREYFMELQTKYGVKLDADQRAWYAKMHEMLGPDKVKEEYPSCVEEAFFNSLEGAYFKKELNKARQEKRIGQPVPHDPSRLVNTLWDIGRGVTAIWFHQSDGVRHRQIDYYEEEAGSLQGACALIHQKRAERGFTYGEHLGPHDIESTEWAADGKDRKSIAADLGVNFTVVKRIPHKADSIEAARRMIGMTWFDSVHCERGVKCLENYTKTWNQPMGRFIEEPLKHNWPNHGADAFQQGAMGLKPERVKKASSGRQEAGSAWAS